MCTNNNHLEILVDHEYVCLNCGLVFGQEFEHVTFPKRSEIDHKSKSIHHDIANFLETLHLNICFTEEIENKLLKYLNKFYCSIEIKIGAAVYYVLSVNNISFPISKIEKLVCFSIRDKKVLYKLINVFKQNTVIENDGFGESFSLATIILSDLGVSSDDRSTIIQRIISVKCDLCSHSPITQIAGQTYLFFKNRNINKLTLDFICSNLSISKNSVYLYLNPKKHSCVNNWNLKSCIL